MRRLLAVLLIWLVGCGGVVFQGALGPADTILTTSGIVSVVQLSTVINNGTFISVTVVTFLLSGTATTQTFCGNFVSQFPVNTIVTVNFSPGTPCSTVQLIVTV
jgi:hypothetical protein